MGPVRGLLRLSTLLIVFCLYAVAILAVAWMPWRYRGARVGAWPAMHFARFVIRLFNMRYTFNNVEILRQHQGFVFPNHTSALDIFLLLHLLPVRFVSKIEVRSYPVVGLLGTAVGAVFVDRQDKQSRERVRQTLGEVERYPPIVIFPEGGIFSPPNRLHPFRYGAFEIAVEKGIPFLPCVMTYEPLDIVFWGDEPLVRMIWRFACYRGPIHAHLQPLHVVHPHPGDDARQLALETHGAMEAVLTYSSRADDILQTGI